MHTPAFTHAGGIVLRRDPDRGPLVLVVRPSRGPEDAWVLPKGHIDPGEDAPEAAVREVAEEASVRGTGLVYMGYTAYEHRGEDVVCAYYRMDDGGAAPAIEDRESTWLPLDELKQAIPYPGTLELITKAMTSSGS